MRAVALIPSTLALASVLTACGQKPELQGAPLPKVWNLPVVQASAGLALDTAAVGSAVSDQRVDVSSRLSGFIRELNVQEGDSVRKGQLLVRIDPSDVEGGVRQAQAGVAAADAAYKDAQSDFERFQRLYDRESASENEFRKVRLKRDATAEALNQSKAAFDTAWAQRAYADIRSPVDGIVVARAKHSGDMALPGMPLLTVEAGRSLTFETSVAEGVMPSIQVGRPVTVRFDRLSTPVKGVVSRVVESADPVTRSHLVKISLPDTPGLTAGMFGRASLPLAQSGAPIIPRSSLTDRGGLRGVFVVDESNHVHFRWLRLGREWNDQVEATAGLQQGERLVAQLEPALREGDSISARAGGPK